MTSQTLTPGLPLEGGFYAGRISINGEQYAIIVAPKALGDFDRTEWNADNDDDVANATSYCHGLANTQAMAAAGSDIAKKVLALDIAGHKDWYITAQDELEVCYRNLKPGTEENHLYARSGINVSAVPPTYPYTADSPSQTQSELFQEGGAEAFETSSYWSSTQHAGGSDYAWRQYFGDGNQGHWGKDYYSRVRAVRRIKI